METIDDHLKGMGWTEIEKGIFSRETLAKQIEQYFKGKQEDLSQFVRRNKGYLELMSKDQQRGYVFVGELQLDRDHESRMMETRRIHNTLERETVFSFVDNEEGMSGFYWEKRG